MPQKTFWRAGHFPTLLAAFLYFDAGSLCWVLLGPLAIQISHVLQLDAAQKGLMVAAPVLAGAFLRVLVGVLVDRYGAKRVGIIAQVLVILGLGAAWLLGVPDFAAVLWLSVALGLAGASFAVAMPLASRWYRPAQQGMALGLVGMGNSGTVLAALFAPALAVRFGWVNVLGLTAVLMCLVLAAFMLLAKDAPAPRPQQSLAGYIKMLALPDSWWFMLFYAVTFGGFVGLAASLSLYFHAQYGLGPVQAGDAVALCAFAGAMVRPVGGWLADRVGGIRVLSVLYIVAAAMLVLVSLGLPRLTMALAAFVVAMLALGAGNGAVFQLVPARFGPHMGVITGLVGFAGGIGGFLLSASLGFAKQYTGSTQAGFLLFAALAMAAFAGLGVVKAPWRAGFAAGGLPGEKVKI